MEEGEEKGIKKGIKKGREEGIQEGSVAATLAIAKNLIQLRIGLQDIAKGTGLSMEMLESLKESVGL